MDPDFEAALYFHGGLSYTGILGALAINHRIVISMRTLKRSLSRQNLFRRRHYTDIVELAVFIHEQIHGSGNQHGYRWMHLKCRQAGMVASRKVVYTLMQNLDPERIELRKNGRLKRRLYFAKRAQLLVACRFVRQTKAIWVVY